MNQKDVMRPDGDEFWVQSKGIWISNLVDNSQPRNMTAFLFFKQGCDLKCFVIIIAFKVANSANHCQNIHTRYEEKQEGEDE